jgi:tetratricopeptide (TPR) repeat protein
MSFIFVACQRCFTWTSIVCVLLLSSLGATAEQRIALVVGNGGYKNVQHLRNPPNDSTDLAASLEKKGFKVTLLVDATHEEMRSELIKFGNSAINADIAVFYFAGHGIEIGGKNWLIPIDAELKYDADMDKETIDLNSIMQRLSTAAFSLIVLDACRNNPFAARMKQTNPVRSADRGLGRIRPTRNVLVEYAARDGTTASDGDGRNSPFTTALLQHLETPGLEVDLLFRRVRDSVIAFTNGNQQPFAYGSLSKTKVYLNAADGITENGVALKCDQLAASPDDDDRPRSIPGVKLEEVDFLAAFPACAEAIREQPNVGRFYLQEGRAVFAAKNYKSALELFERASALGNKLAMHNIGSMYYYGRGVPVDLEKSKGWFQKAADLGFTRAMAGLAEVFLDESHGTADYKKALTLLEQAAALGLPSAMTSLGYLYEQGRGVPRALELARKWYVEAAELGDPTAMRNLGIWYQNGFGVEKDLFEAKRWYEQAAVRGDADAARRLKTFQ